MRCSTAFQRPSIGSFLADGLVAWLTAKGIKVPEAGSKAAAAQLSADRERLAAEERRSGADSLAVVSPLFDLAGNPAIPIDEANALALRATAIVERFDPTPIAHLAVQRLVHSTRKAERESARGFRNWLETAVASPRYTADPEARNAALLMMADALRGKDSARTYLTAVGNDAGLPANHPFKVGALIRLASLEQAKGDAAAARSAFDRSGLSAQQCALLDARPAIRASGASAARFPDEAFRWGFEGWTMVQADIAADGKTQNVRVVASYPPFVFNKAGMEIGKAARYAPSYRPDGGLGCGGQVIPVRFTLGQ